MLTGFVKCKIIMPLNFMNAASWLLQTKKTLLHCEIHDLRIPVQSLAWRECWINYMCWPTLTHHAIFFYRGTKSPQSCCCLGQHAEFLLHLPVSRYLWFTTANSWDIWFCWCDPPQLAILESTKVPLQPSQNNRKRKVGRFLIKVWIAYTPVTLNFSVLEFASHENHYIQNLCTGDLLHPLEGNFCMAKTTCRSSQDTMNWKKTVMISTPKIMSEQVPKFLAAKFERVNQIECQRENIPFLSKQINRRCNLGHL